MGDLLIDRSLQSITLNRNYISQIDLLTEEKNKLYEDNTKMYNDIDQLQSHIALLKEQNRKLTQNPRVTLNEPKMSNDIVIEDNKSNDELSD